MIIASSVKERYVLFTRKTQFKKSNKLIWGDNSVSWHSSFSHNSIIAPYLKTLIFIRGFVIRIFKINIVYNNASLKNEIKGD